MHRYRVTPACNRRTQRKQSKSSLPTKPQQSIADERKLSHRIDDNELGIFEAERYFSEGHEGIKRAIKQGSVSSAKSLQSSMLPTPTDSSVTSWTTDPVLLSHQPSCATIKNKAFASKNPRKSLTCGIRRMFGRNCPCSGKKAVDVEEKYWKSDTQLKSHFVVEGKRSSCTVVKNQDNKLTSIPERSTAVECDEELNEVATLTITAGKWAKDQTFLEGFSPKLNHPILKHTGRTFMDPHGFSFPVLNHPPSLKTTDEPPRHSIEVFRPSEESPPAQALKKSAEIQRRSSVLPVSSESYSKSFNFSSSPKIRPDDDAASDTSSDLFEIESFSTYHRHDLVDERFVGYGAAAGVIEFRRSLDDAGAPSITPNEVSVEWSVNTAEGLDWSSTGTNFSSSNLNQHGYQFDRTGIMIGNGVNDGGRPKGNGILSCRCEKAVTVGPNSGQSTLPVELNHLRIAKSANESLTGSLLARYRHTVKNR